MSFAYVITTCGSKKFQGPARAADFYMVPFVQKQGEVAAVLKPRGGRLVLSNKYGFMHPDYVIPGPYNSHWGYPDTMPDAQLKAQIARLGLRPGDVVVCLGAEEYARQTRRLFPSYVKVIWPPKHLFDRRIGYQGKLYNEVKQLRRLPSRCMNECEYVIE